MLGNQLGDQGGEGRLASRGLTIETGRDGWRKRDGASYGCHAKKYELQGMSMQWVCPGSWCRAKLGTRDGWWGCRGPWNIPRAPSAHLGFASAARATCTDPLGVCREKTYPSVSGSRNGEVGSGAEHWNVECGHRHLRGHDHGRRSHGGSGTSSPISGGSRFRLSGSIWALTRTCLTTMCSRGDGETPPHVLEGRDRPHDVSRRRLLSGSRSAEVQ